MGGRETEKKRERIKQTTSKRESLETANGVPRSNRRIEKILGLKQEAKTGKSGGNK